MQTNTQAYDISGTPDVIPLAIAPPKERAKRRDHTANLAETLSEARLRTIVSRCQQWLDWDEDSRRDWFTRLARGIRLLGVTDTDVRPAPYEGAAQLAHPLLAEACIQFNARTIAELWPPGGPAKTVVMGDKTGMKQSRADRVKDYINYLHTNEIPNAFEDFDKLIFRVGLEGSIFRRKYYCRLRKRIQIDTVNQTDFIVPYNTDASLEDAHRFTHIKRMTTQRVRTYIKAGEYRDIGMLREPIETFEDENRTKLLEETDSAEGRSQSLRDDNERHTVCMMHCYLNLEDPADDGRASSSDLRPYNVIFERMSGECYAIYRDWEEDDPAMERVNEYTHYYTMPGLGFYGFGYLHYIGSMTDAASGALNALLDAAANEQIDRGFYDNSVDMSDAGDGPLGQGEWRGVNATGEELSKAFFPMPKARPSQTLLELMGHVEDLSRRIVSTTDEMVGDKSNNVPVGTTLARIEQGLKVYTAIHKRMHKAQEKDLKFIKRLCHNHMPRMYPYSVAGASRFVKQEDFSDDVEVIPVSDQNIVTQGQKLYLAEYVLDLAQRAPHLYNLRALHRHVLETIRFSAFDDILVPAEEEMTERKDPVSEYMNLLTGKPIKAYPEQHHDAHIITHQGQLAMLSGPAQKTLGPILQAHIQEHQAWSYTIQISNMMGIPVTQRDPNDSDIALAAAQATVQMMPQQQPSQEEMAAQRHQQLTEADIARQNAKARADIMRRDAEAQAKIAREEATTANEIGRKTRAQEAELTMDVIKGFAEEQRAIAAQQGQVPNQPD